MALYRLIASLIVMWVRPIFAFVQGLPTIYIASRLSPDSGWLASCSVTRHLPAGHDILYTDRTRFPRLNIDKIVAVSRYQQAVRRWRFI